MPATNDRQLRADSVPDLLNPTFIAQLASRLYNELPGAGDVPRSESELHDAPQSAASTGQGHSTNAAGYGDGSQFDWQPDLPWFPGEAPVGEGDAFYFLQGDNGQKEAPLEHHAERLTEEQAYSGNSNGSYGLDELLKRPQANKSSHEQIPFSGFSHDAPVSLDFLSDFGINGFPQGSCIAQDLFRKFAGQADGHHAPIDQPPVPSGLSAGVPSGVPDFAGGPYYFLNEPVAAPVTKTEIFDVASVRRDFPVLHQNIHGKPLVWLDNAATTQKPLSVINALSQFYSTDNSNIHRGAHTLAARATDAYEGAREKIRQFIGASSTSEIIYVRGTTEGVNLVAQTWGRKFIQPGDEIVLSILEHHANIVPWQMLAQEKGAIIRVVPVNDRGEILMEEYTRLLGPRTKFVSLTQASNGLGTILPIREMIQLAKRHDAKVLIDGAQSVAHIPVNVQDLDADFFVFSGHKIFAPTGIGAVYGKRELLDQMPPWQGGGNMIRDVRFEQTIYNEAPAKFEAGTPSIGDAIGLGAALDYVRKIGLENIARYEHELTEYATSKLTAIDGLRLIGTARDKVGVLSFVLAGIPNDDVGRLLDREGIAVRTGHHCTQPSLRRFGVEGTVRPSLAFYNTKDEIDRLADVVSSIRRR